MEEIYEKYYEAIYKYLLSISYNKDIAEELTQETFYRAIVNINKFRGDCDFQVWLYVIARNLYYKYRKKNKKIIYTENFEFLENYLCYSRYRRRYYTKR